MYKCKNRCYAGVPNRYFIGLLEDVNTLKNIIFISALNFMYCKFMRKNP